MRVLNQTRGPRASHRASGLIALVLLAGCGGSSAPAVSSAPPTSSAPAPPSAKPSTAAQASGVSAKPSAAASGSAAASPSFKPAASGLTLVRMGPPSVDLNYQLPYVVARNQGYFQTEGIDAQMNLVAGNIAVPALLKGELDLTNHGAAMTATMQGAGATKSVWFPYNTSTLTLTVNTSKVKEAQDLVGQVVAVDTLGNAQDQGTRAIIQSLGIDPAKVDIRPLQNSNNRLAAMLSGQVAATADNPSIVAQLLAKGGFKILGDASKVQNIPWSGYAATDQYITSHHAALLGWERAMTKAVVFIQKNPDQTVDIVNKETGLDKDVAKGALPLLVKVMYPDDPGGWTEQGMLNQVASVKKAVPNAKDATIDQVSDIDIVREAQKSLGIQCKGGYKC